MVTLSLAEASKVSGKSIPSVRRWIKDGLLSAEKNDRGCWVLNSDVLQSFMATHPTIKRSRMSNYYEANSAEPSVEILKEALQRERSLNDELRKKVDEKDSEIFKLLHEMKAVLDQKGDGFLSRWIRK